MNNEIIEEKNGSEDVAVGKGGTPQRDEYAFSRLLYIIEAALEYFIALGVGGAYLARLGLEMGMSESLIAIIEAFVSLGGAFQIFAVFLANKTPVKLWVTVSHLICNVFFALTWFTPLFKGSDTAKAVLFVFLIFVARVIYNVTGSSKTNWHMSLVDDNKRGSFTATKEIVSLISGMLFSFLYGNIIEYFENNDRKEIAFVLCGSLLLFITVMHLITMLVMKEKPVERKNKSFKQSFLGVIKDKRLFLVIVVPVVWNIIHYATLPFFAIYLNTELGFSAFYISVVSMVYSIIRAIVSKPLGRFADKFSFSAMLNICLASVALGFFINIFTVPSNGHVLYVIFYAFFGIGMGGINSSSINLIYDMVDRENRTAAIALKSALAGVIGFVTTLAFTPFVDYIQKSGNKFLGINAYAPQVLSALAVIITVALLMYNKLVIGKLKRVSDKSS